MKNLKRLAVTLALTLILAGTALAGITETPPCDPGETHGPPCAAAPMNSNDPEAPGETSTPPASSEVDLITIAEAALWTLLLF